MRAARRLTALVVDDDVPLRECFREILEEEGYRTRTAGSVAEALECIDEAPPDLLLVDYVLSGETSDALLALLAVRADAPATVIVSASPRVPYVALQFGVLFVPKPFSLEHLTQMLSRALVEGRRPRPF